MSSAEKYQKMSLQEDPCGCLENDGTVTPKVTTEARFKTCLHTGNLLTSGHENIRKDALSISGFKNHELVSGLKFLNQKIKAKNFTHLNVDYEKNLNTTIDIDFTKITTNNPITVSLKLFLSKSVCPKTVKKYVDVFQKIYGDTLVKNEYASRKDCLEKIQRERNLSGEKEKEQQDGMDSQQTSGHSSARSSISTQGNLDQDTPLDDVNDPCSKFKIDILVLSLSKNIRDYASTSHIQDYVYPFYRQLEDLVESDRVRNIGLSDVTSEMLTELENHCRVKPSVVQVKYTSMNHLDKEITDMMDYGEKNDVLMLRHSDEVPFLTSCKMNEILCETEGEAVGEGSEIQNIDAVLRYTLTSKWHSVLLGKGYLIFEN